MYDYKFRQSDSSFNKPKRVLNKAMLGISGLAFAVAALYGVAQLDFSSQAQPDEPEASSDVIPLALPPRVEPKQRAEPSNIPTDRTFSDGTKFLEDQGQTSS
jgi:hypothetical protein